MLHQKIFQHNLELYNLQLGPEQYFMRGSYFVFGELWGKRFGSHARSGSQSLWLPLKNEVGLKLFHPKGFSGSLGKAWMYFKVQKLLFDVGLAPEPLKLFNVEVYFVYSNVVVTSDPFNLKFVKSGNIIGSPWKCYGVLMNQVLKGSLNQVLDNLERFGVERNDFVCQNVYSYLLKRNNDALNLYEYQKLVNFFGGHEESTIRGILKDVKERLPSNVDEGDDIFSLKNIVLDASGKPKVIDCDLASLK